MKSEQTILVVEDSERLNDLYEDGKLLISEITKDNFKLKYGISDESTGLSVAHANQPIRIVAKEDSVNTNVNIEFLFDEDNKTLIDKIEIYAEKNSNLNVIINYMPKLANGDFSELQKEALMKKYSTE